jgi:hypothetical protein
MPSSLICLMRKTDKLCCIGEGEDIVLDTIQARRNKNFSKSRVPVQPFICNFIIFYTCA